MATIKYLKLSDKLASLRLTKIDTPTKAKPVVKKLRKVIAFHDDEYYKKNTPLISDAEYDKLFRKLRILEEMFSLVSSTSPTQRVASDISNEFIQVRHLTPMLSLDNTYKTDDLEDFERRTLELPGIKGSQYSAELKYDGAGISLFYEDDQFIRAVTRGDGISGDDISNNLQKLDSLPLSAPFSRYGIYRIEIRGEIIIRKKTFQKINASREAEGLPVFANARNAAAGSMRLLDAREAKKRGMEVFVYHVSLAEDKKAMNLLSGKLHQHDQFIHMLDSCGFKTPVREMKVYNHIREAQLYCKRWQNKRDSFPYEIDGIVIKVNDLRNYKDLGFTSHHPRWAVAFKFKPRQAITKLQSVIFQVGRTGAITPVAKLKPVNIGGVMVGSASLHNEDYIRTKDIRSGDQVLVERAGDVIPYVVHPVLNKRKGRGKKISFPKKCPSCRSPLIREKEDSVWRCMNFACEAQSMERINHFVSKQALDIDGMGRSTIELFFSKGILKSIIDIYRLDYSRIRKLPGFGEKSVRNLRAVVEKSKLQPVHRLINGLGIRMVGSTGARKLAEEVKCIDDFFKWKKSRFQSIAGIGEKVANQVYQFFHTPKNQKLVRALKQAGVKICNEKKGHSTTGPLKGLKFVFTGSLEKFSREEAQKLVTRKGGEVSDSISTKTDYMVTGEKPGSKLHKARKFSRIRILNEAEFMGLMKNK